MGLWGDSVPFSLRGFYLSWVLVSSVIKPEPFLALLFCIPAFWEKQPYCWTNPSASVLAPSGVPKRDTQKATVSQGPTGQPDRCSRP